MMNFRGDYLRTGQKEPMAARRSMYGLTPRKRRVTPRKDEADGLQPGPPSCFAHVQSLSVCISSTEPVAVSK